MRVVSLQLPAQVGQLVVHELDHVEAVEDQGRLGQMSPDGIDVGLGHVGRHGLDPGSGHADPPPEGIESIGASSLAHEDHGPALQIEHHREVALAPFDGDLVDGDPSQIPELRLAEPTQQLGLQDLLHQPPAHPEMAGDVPHRHAPGEVEDVAGKALRVPMLARRERDLGLPDAPTCLAAQTGDPELDPHRTPPDRQPPESPRPPALADHSPAPAGHTSELVLRGLDGEVDLAAPILRLPIGIAADAEGVVQ